MIDPMFQVRELTEYLERQKDIRTVQVEPGIYERLMNARSMEENQQVLKKVRVWQLKPDETEEAIAAYAKEIAAEFDYGTNMRGSAEYRQHLAEVLLRRSISSMLTEDK